MVDSCVAAVSRTVKRKGTGLETPNYGSSCKVKLKILSEDGNVLQSCEKQVVIGEGDSEASDSLDKCLECMHAEEICVIPYRSESFDQEVCVASERDLKCEVELLCFSKAKDSWETTPEEKMSLALHHKAKGTDCFKVENPLRLNFNWHTCIYISPATHTCIATCIFICTFETEP
ncbi:peptidyl-prolyl cis-trans isomerase FKBP5-like [Orbicella faveolata]|uniref:peptidyl-prolyl cis-trans isomerase FKBP5-like n=1 Tax=Orbicella faveolata TaxID=48498 RepID=UPI0009E4D8C5|nr:peptidyl-prolyl cis-trans isomerase FKBP5-like [Orbicella faveolata]